MQPGNLRLLPVYKEKELADLSLGRSSSSLSTAIYSLRRNSDFKQGDPIVVQPERNAIVLSHCFDKALPFVGCRF